MTIPSVIRRAGGLDVALVGGAVLLLALLAGPVATIGLRIPLDYNEGWNAGFDTRAVFAGQGPLYPGAGTLVFNNYPPLGFLLVGAFGRFAVGDMIVAGRFAALAGLLLSAGFVALALHRLGVRLRPALAAGLMLPLLIATFFRVYVAMDDPQWLAHATMLGGLVVLGGRDMPAPRIVAACLLMVAGGFIKHNLVALPVATTIWLFWMKPRAGWVWLATAACAIGAGLTLTLLAYGPVALADIFHHRRVIELSRIGAAGVRLAPLLPGLLVVAWLLPRTRHRAALVLVGPMLAIALITGALQRVGQGVYYNAHFETVIALCLALGVVLDESPAMFAGTPAWVIAALPLLVAAPRHVGMSLATATHARAEEAAWAPVIGGLRTANGTVGCQMLSLCYWAGKPFTVDMFNLTQSVLTGGSAARFSTMVAGGAFALFEDDPTSSIHRDAVRVNGRDPLMAPFEGRYVALATGLGQVRLLAPAATVGSDAGDRAGSGPD